MKLSIRTRLTLWYVTLLTVSLIAFGTIFSYSLFRIFMNRIDSEISSVANMMIHAVIRPSGQLLLPRNFDIILERFFGIRTSGNYIQILGPDGRVVAKSSNLAKFSLPVPEEVLKEARKGHSTVTVVNTADRFPVRVVTKPVIVKNVGLVAMVQVGRSLKGMEEIFHSLLYIFAVGIVLSVVTASAVGWFLARKALKPVSEITDMARRLSARSLNERLSIKGPKDEIGRLASTFNEMIARLERSFEQIKRFTADASHELKTPLTVMKGEIEVALRGESMPEHLKSVLVSCLEEIDRLNYIVKNLLDLAKTDAESAATVKTEVRLDKIISDRYELFRKIAVEKGIELDILKNRPIVVMGDPVRLGQLVHNLIDNAIKYTPAPGKVEVSLERLNGSALLKVRDTGVGISEEDLPHIFDRFYRVDRARTREAGGAGLGLSICKEIAEAYGGTIKAESEQGRGTVFTVVLPLKGGG